MKKFLILVAALFFSFTIYFWDYIKQPQALASDWKMAFRDRYSQMLLGHRYDHGEGVAKNKERAVYWFTIAAKRGDVDAMHYLANILDEHPTTMPEAMYWYEKAANTPGLEESYKAHLLQDLNYLQFNLGGAYMDGAEVKKDRKKGLELLEKSASKKGAETPQITLAIMYATGMKGVEKDKAKALYWANLAKEEGSRRADVLIEEIHKAFP